MTRSLVLIRWTDSHYRPGWTTEEPSPEGLSCESVGWVVAESAEALTICGTLSADGAQRLGDFTIPKGAIQQVRQIGKGRHRGHP